MKRRGWRSSSKVPHSAHPSMSGQRAIGLSPGCFASCGWNSFHHSDCVTLLLPGEQQAQLTRDYLDRSFESASMMGSNIDLAVKHQRQINDKVRIYGCGLHITTRSDLSSLMET